jgi:hypothetical protein
VAKASTRSPGRTSKLVAKWLAPTKPPPAQRFPDATNLGWGGPLRLDFLAWEASVEEDGLFLRLPNPLSHLAYQVDRPSNRIDCSRWQPGKEFRNYLLRKGFRLPGRKGLGVFAAKLLPN